MALSSFIGIQNIHSYTLLMNKCGQRYQISFCPSTQQSAKSANHLSSSHSIQNQQYRNVGSRWFWFHSLSKCFREAAMNISLVLLPLLLFVAVARWVTWVYLSVPDTCCMWWQGLWVVTVVVVNVMRMALVVMLVVVKCFLLLKTQVWRRRRGCRVDQTRAGGEVHQVPQGSIPGQARLLLC